MNQPLAHALADLDDIRQFESTSHLRRYPFGNSYELLMQSCRQFRNDKALSFLPTGAADDVVVETSYRQLSERVTQTANLLSGLGVGFSDAVTILLPMLPETHYALLGASAAGIASPVNPFLENDHIAEIMNSTRSKVLLTLAPGQGHGLWEKAIEVIQNTPTVRAIVLISIPEKARTVIPASPREGIVMVDYSRKIDGQHKDKLASGRVFDPNDIAMYLHTGGTTKRPKIAKLSHGNLSFMAQLYVDMTAGLGRFSALCGLPLFHVFGITSTGLAAFAGGRHMILMTPTGFRNPEVIRNFWHHVARFRCSIFATVPTVLSSLLAVPAGENDISCLKEVSSGGAPLPYQLKRNFEEHFNVRVFNGYGMTESSLMLAKASPLYTPPKGSVGMRIPYIRIITALVEGDRLIHLCKANETGVILCQGPNIFSGYLDPKDNEGTRINYYWFNTGDLGHFDEHGHLFITGRAKDLIIRGGHNIDPALIEEPLNDHPAVAQVVAVGQPDPYAGEIPVAFVTLEPGQTIKVEELLEYCNNNISERAAIPKRIEFIEEMPLTAVAKFYKPELRQRATDFAISASLDEAGIAASVETKLDQQSGLATRVSLADTRQRKQAESLLQGYPLSIEFD